MMCCPWSLAAISFTSTAWLLLSESSRGLGLLTHALQPQESSWPRKKDKKEIVLFSLKQLRKKCKGAAFASVPQLIQHNALCANMQELHHARHLAVTTLRAILFLLLLVMFLS